MLFTIRSTNFIFRRGNVIDIQSYTRLFAAQISFSQQALESLGTMWCIYGSIQDARNSWDFAMAFNTYAGFGYLLPQ